MAALPHRFGDRTPIADVRSVHDGLPAGERSGASYRLAGRVMARRGQGKLSFLDLEDRSGRMQLLASEDRLGPELFEAVREVKLGDVVGVEGEAVASRRGELSLDLTGYQLLAHCQLPLPDLHHGLTDVEARYRQRYLDLLVNAGEPHDLPAARARDHRAAPASRRGRLRRGRDADPRPLYGGANARPFTTHHNELDRDLYLRIATELYLKRLVVGGLERVYEIGKNFRNEGVSYKHNPEFTLLEWYEAYADCEDAMRRTEDLVRFAAQQALGTTVIEAKGQAVDLAPPWARIPLGLAIAEKTGVDPLEGPRDEARLRGRLEADGVDTTHDTSWAALVDHMLSHYVEPYLVEPTFLVDYPVELSPLARRNPDDPTRVERFEAFCGGMEIANGFSELIDPDDQLARFEDQAELGRAGDAEAHPVDHDYVNALRYGLPPTGGVGLGIDRVLMLLTGRDSIREVVLFPALRDR